MELHAQIACAMPRELARKGIGWQARAVYAEAVLYCRENLTDGVISRGELPFWMADMPVKARAAHLDVMVTVGALRKHPAGWQFPERVWSKWNPSKAEVDAKRAEDAARKADWRARRKAQRDESVPAVSQRDTSGRDRHRDATATECPRQPEPEPEPEPNKKSAQDDSLAPIVTSLAHRLRYRDEEAS